MIINFPTGYYSTVLPGLEDSGNITFMISMTSPPRTDLLFQKAPNGIILKQLPSVGDSKDNRVAGAELIYSISNANRSKSNNNDSLYQSGDILEFEYSSNKKLELTKTGDYVEVRHDTKIYDYEKLGITQTEVDLIHSLSYKTMDELSNKLNTLKSKWSDLIALIASNEKMINDKVVNT